MIINQNERDALYKTIYNRRDVRGQFLAQEIDAEVLERILKAAHHAPSVGFMQPWDFVVVSDAAKKQAIKAGFDAAHARSATLFAAQKQQIYKTLKLEGIIEAPLGIVVTCDRRRNGPVVIGRTINPQMDLYSSVCAVQNLWLAARAENLGVGWVSIIEDAVLRSVLGIPESIEIIAYLCLGHVSHFKEQPELESNGWLARRELKQAIHYEGWSVEQAAK